MSQQYSLRWNNHQPNFISMFTTLLNTQTLVDVTLAADGKQLLAHKVVLSACSTYFQSLFVDNPSPHPIVILKDVTYADLRTMVDFMYCGEVNVTEEQLPKVLDTAKLLKIKGLTEMPDSTSLTRSQGTSAEFQGDSMDSQRHSPPASPTTKRKRRRKSSTGSTSLNMVGEENRSDVGAQAVDAITLSSVPQQRRMREYHEVRTIDNAQQTTETENMNVEHNMGMDNTSTGLAQGTESSHTDSISRLRRSKHFKRQNRVQPEERELRKQVSEPAAAPTLTVKPAATLQKHESYPQYVTPKPFRRLKITKSDHETSSSLLIRPVTLSKLQSPSGDQPSISDRPASLSERKPSTTDRQTSVSERPGSLTERQGSVSERQPSLSERQPSLTERQPSLSDRQASVSDRQSSTSERQSSTSTTSTSFEYSSASESSQTLRASHTPAVRSGPPLSCNFCWNTVDECGRILRRKTQYHCPECRTNLCIVPCFHEYHEGPVAQSAANVR